MSVTVSLSLTELAAIARAAWVVTSLGEPREVNGADSAIRKLRQAAKAHPALPERLGDQSKN
ncbi:hypothetical protein L6E12_03750 [Actinokineospora sp. PR83]|uniref:hypothetical protein n=1 Tax=Actinokineospora sp. PR83 TaxID=2884908 RepID=UPI001F18DAAA|nr:hypothetical protein [Actinokineospora sp. PR83]MCG8914903.1 hypothetical protein [Actinokineospora sp. PR83]